MKPLNIFQRFVRWVREIPAKFCDHEFTMDFRGEYRQGWEQSSGCIECDKCGSTFGYTAFLQKNPYPHACSDELSEGKKDER